MALPLRGDEAYGGSAGAYYTGAFPDGHLRTFGGLQALSGGTCPKCGKGMLPDSRFCWNCGFKLSEAPRHDAALHPCTSPDAFGAVNGFSPAMSSPAPLPITKPLSDGRILAGQASTLSASEPEATLPDARRGKADILYTGIDADRNGVPDILEEVRRPLGSHAMPGSPLPEPMAPSQSPPEVLEAFRPVPARPTLGEEAPFSPSPYPFPATGLPVTESPPPPRPREAPAPYTFPTAGSFVAEPFHESQMAYPSASRDRWSEEPVPGSVPRDPMLDRYAHPPSRQTPDALTGDWYRDGHRSYHTGLGASPSSPSLGTYGSSFAGSNGTSRNGYACANGYANGNAYSYSGLLNKGDTYSGGTVSYGPPPTRCGAYSSGCGGCGSAGMNPLGFPSIGSFVAEPFAPGAPTLSSSRVPPPLPSPLPSFSGPSLLGGSFNFGGFSLPPPTGSFVADPAAYAAASHGGGQSPTAATAEAPLGVSAPAPEKAASPAPGKAEGRAETLPAPKAPPRAMAKEKSKKRKPARGACC